MTEAPDDPARLVKPLQWEDKSNPITSHMGELDIEGRWRYLVSDMGGSGHWVLRRYGVSCGEYHTSLAAQAAAQADYTTRSLAALNTDALRAMRAERDAMMDALVKITEGDVPRPVAKVFRADGVATKHDLCIHVAPMYEDCAGCIDAFLIATLAKIGGAK